MQADIRGKITRSSCAHRTVNALTRHLGVDECMDGAKHLCTHKSTCGRAGAHLTLIELQSILPHLAGWGSIVHNPHRASPQQLHPSDQHSHRQHKRLKPLTAGSVHTDDSATCCAGHRQY